MLHTFQPLGLEYAQFNPFNKIGKDWVLITAGDENKVNTMTAGWGGAGVMWGKNVAFIVIRESRYTKEFIDKQDTFSVTFLDKSQRAAMKYLGQVSGRDEDKIGNARMHINYHEGTPFIDEGSVVVICKKLSKTEILPDQFIDPEIDSKWYADKDYHTMYIGEIVELMAR